MSAHAFRLGKEVWSMTRRVCSAVLALVMVMSLFTGLTPRVSAEDTYEKTVSVSPDDVVLLVCEGAGVELGGISAASPGYGIGEAFDAVPAGAFRLTVVPGYAQGTFAFRNGIYSVAPSVISNEVRNPFLFA